MLQNLITLVISTEGNECLEDKVEIILFNYIPSCMFQNHLKILLIQKILKTDKK